jgi:hypothetical protein
MLTYLNAVSTYLLLFFFYSSVALVAAVPFKSAANSNVNMTSDLMNSQSKRASPINGLPHPWTGVFKTVASIQPPLPVIVFTHFFTFAAKQAAAGLVPERPYQKITYGSLVLEFWAHNSGVVTKELMQAVALWLLDSAEKGWMGFFEARVMDRADQEIILIQLGTVWDSVWGQTIDWSEMVM